MNCKYLSGSSRCYCSASDKLMTPSIYELCTFCYGAPTDCLIYQERENANAVKNQTETPAPEQDVRFNINR